MNSPPGGLFSPEGVPQLDLLTGNGSDPNEQQQKFIEGESDDHQDDEQDEDWAAEGTKLKFQIFRPFI